MSAYRFPQKDSYGWERSRDLKRWHLNEHFSRFEHWNIRDYSLAQRLSDDDKRDIRSIVRGIHSRNNRLARTIFILAALIFAAIFWFMKGVTP